MMLWLNIFVQNKYDCVIGANTCCAMQVTFVLGERQVADPAHVTPREFAGKLVNLDKYIF